jgi:hypothetical protein
MCTAFPYQALVSSTGIVAVPRRCRRAAAAQQGNHSIAPAPPPPPSLIHLPDDWSVAEVLEEELGGRRWRRAAALKKETFPATCGVVELLVNTSLKT